MSWGVSSLTWPESADLIQKQAESVTHRVGETMKQASERVMALKSDANFKRHELSMDASAIASLRNDMMTLLQCGQILTVSPYQFPIATQLESGGYLNPRDATQALANKLRDNNDSYRCSGQLYAVAVMMTAENNHRFSQLLSRVVDLFPIPDWCQCARQSTSRVQHEKDKMQQPEALVLPRLSPPATININPLRDFAQGQGMALATLESLASDELSIADKLQSLSDKRADALQAASDKINQLKMVNGQMFVAKLNGTVSEIANQLGSFDAPNHHSLTVASVMMSREPLSFFSELFSG